MANRLYEMAAVIADEFGAEPQVDGEGDCHFIVDMFCIAADPAEGTP